MPLTTLPRLRGIIRTGEAGYPTVEPPADGLFPGKGHFATWPGKGKGFGDSPGGGRGSKGGEAPKASPFRADRWRVYMAAPISGSYISASEIEFRKAPGGDDRAVGGTPSASSEIDAAGAATKAFDDDTGTRWATLSGQKPAWVEYHFPSYDKIAEVAYTTVSSVEQSPNDIDVEAFDIATGLWTKVGEFPQSAWSAFEQRILGSFTMPPPAFAFENVPAAASLEVYSFIGPVTDQCSVQALTGYTITGAPNTAAAALGFEVYTITGPAGDQVASRGLEAYTILGAPPSNVAAQVLEVYTIVEV